MILEYNVGIVIGESKKSSGSWLVFTQYPLYHLVISHSHGKTPFLRTVNHLFRLGPSIPIGYVSHNQRVTKKEYWMIAIGMGLIAII